MSQLDRIFERQARVSSQEEDVDTMRVFVLLTIGESRVVVPIERLREVVEATQVTPYPLPEPGYVGVANLRGNLLPVVTPELLGSGVLTRGLADPRDQRLLVVFETEGNALIGVRASAVRKIIVGADDMPKGDGCDDVIAVGGDPVRVLSVDALHAGSTEPS